ncbi:MAG: SH3 domain-containing protein [Lachnospiraceae bacterium]|nr:SH3 domain-containing protein [Lachnospiraceae bacterium]
MKIRDFVLKHSKIVFPVIIVVLVAITVVVAMSFATRDRMTELSGDEAEKTNTVDISSVGLVPLVENTDQNITELMNTLYTAKQNGDRDTLVKLFDTISEQELIREEEVSKYVDNYTIVDVFTKPGSEEGSTLVYVYFTVKFTNHEENVPGYITYYVCTAEDGSLYIKQGDVTDAVNEYNDYVTVQDDVIELHNKVTSEFNTLRKDNPELASYLVEFQEQINISVGEKLGALKSSEGSENADTGGEAGSTEGETGETNAEEEPAQTGPQYVTATTTVNVRGSDSENADKVGKVSTGTKLELVEQQLNGWSKVIYENNEAFIKSEYLELIEDAGSAESVGKVKATTNVNVRSTASETGEKIGILTAGDVVDYVAVEGDWTKIKYNSRLGYVKTEFLERQ